MLCPVRSLPREFELVDHNHFFFEKVGWLIAPRVVRFPEKPVCGFRVHRSAKEIQHFVYNYPVRGSLLGVDMNYGVHMLLFIVYGWGKL